MDDDLVSASLRRLRAFLVVCDTLHLGRAAEQLGIAQPALSQQIRGLEEGLGVRLFHRRKRGIDLTAAGLDYRHEADALLRLHAQAADRARRIARGELGRVAIGYVASAMLHEGFPALLGAMGQRHPGVQIELFERGLTEVMASLSQGDIDLAVVRGPVPLAAQHAHHVASSEPLVAVLPTLHRLADATQVSLADLSEERLIAFNDPADTGLLQVSSALAATVGATLNVGWRVSAMTSVLGLAAAGLGYGIVPGEVARMTMPGIRFVPLRETGATAALWYLWRRDRITPALETTFLKELPARG
jgi:DNA-binding transcriptional LysR family regulator